MAITNSTDFYRRPYLTTITFAVGVLLFLLPFFDIKCNGITMAQVSGMDMATAGRPKLGSDLEKMQNGIGKRTTSDGVTVTRSSREDGKLFISALVALLLGVAGVVLSLVAKRRNQRAVMIVGMLAAVALIAVWIEVASFVKSDVNTNSGDTGEFNLNVSVSATPTFWYILSLLCFAAAAFISYKKAETLTTAHHDVPPAGAPQVKIENPGDQSEFPPAPTGERELG